MNKKLNNIEIGKNAEEKARRYLEKKGYLFLAQNFYSSLGEIDLIMMDQKILVFVEVKYRKGKQIQDIEKTINRKKINRISKTAEIYIENTKLEFEETRIDAVFVKETGYEIEIKHFQNWA